MTTLEVEAGLDPVRQLILTRTAERKLDLKRLSLAAGLNETYLQQFIRKHVPKQLPEDVRDFLVTALDVPADALGPTRAASKKRLRRMKRKSNVIMLKVPQATLVNVPLKPVETLAAVSTAAVRGRLPIYSCPGAADEVSVAGWAARPACLTGSTGAFAVWAPFSVGRIRAGDLLFVHPTQPPRREDAVVVICERRILSIGELLERGSSHACVKAPEGDTSFDIPRHQLMRIAMVLIP